MRTRAGFAGLVAIATVVVAGPASAKVDIAKASIAGPGIEQTLRIEAPDTYGLWDSGIDAEGGLDDARAESVEELGLTVADLGPRYLVTYRFGIGRAMQELYPYAKGGPVAYTLPDQELGRRSNTPDFLRNLPIVSGWYQSDRVFFHYLVDHGLPETNPVPSLAARERTRDIAPGSRTLPWAGIAFLVRSLETLFCSSVRC